MIVLAMLACVNDTTVDAPEVQIHIEPGVRDLVAAVNGPVTLDWSKNGEPMDLHAHVVPAREIFPGDRWEVTARNSSAVAATAAVTIPPPPGGNLLVLLMDDVGVDRVGSYDGIFAGRTPRIDQLAAEGIRFSRAYASPVCSPTRGVLLTGRHARRTGLGWIVDTGTRAGRLSLDAVLIPEALDFARGSQWDHSAIGKWHVIGPSAQGYLTHPNDQGFNYFAGAPGNPAYGPGGGYWHWEKNINGTVEVSTTYMTIDAVDEALGRMQVMSEPWLLYVPFNAAHGPLSTPPAELVTDVPDAHTPREHRFGAVLEAMDTEIGRLLDTMDPALRSRTTIMVIGDNGTAPAGVPVDQWENRYKHTPYEGGIKVPFIVTGPHVREPGRVSDALIHVADVMPTALDLAGVPLEGVDGEFMVLEDEIIELDGRSLLPHMLDPNARSREFIYAEAFSPNGPPPYGLDRRALRNETHKIVRRGSTEEFYRLEGEREMDVTDLLQTGVMTAEDQRAYERLRYLLDEQQRILVYEGR